MSVRCTATDASGNTASCSFQVTVVCAAPPRFLRADANASGAADMSDAVFTLSWLFLGGPAPTCLAAANVNADAAVDISDATHLLSHLFLGGPPPAVPFPACGAGELDADAELGCETTTAACS